MVHLGFDHDANVRLAAGPFCSEGDCKAWMPSNVEQDMQKLDECDYLASDPFSDFGGN